MIQTETRHRWLFWTLGVIAAAFYVAFVVRSAFSIAGTRYFSLFDDGMISMRFARHLADGHGLTWNIGEAPVEGYTNFLWTLYMAALHRLPVPTPWLSLLVMLTGVAVLLALLAVVGDITRRLADGRTAPVVIALALVAFHYPLVFWTLRGMEVGVLALFIYGAIAMAFRLEARYSRARLLAVTALLALALLTRLDAVVPYTLIALYLIVSLPARHRLEAGAMVAAALVVPLGAQTAMRRAYYHDWLPNTYYLKVTGVALLDRLTRGVKVWLQSYGFHLYPYMAAVPAALIARGGDPRILLLAAMFAFQSAYSIYVGGDAWEWVGTVNRYVSLAVPALAVLAGLGVESFFRSVEGRVAAWRLATLVVAGALAARGLLATWPPGDGRTTGAVWIVLAAGVAIAGWRVAAWLSGRLSTNTLTGERALLAIAGCALLIVAPANARMIGGWLTNNAIHVQDDANATRLGLFIRETTHPDAVIAVRWAGAIPYFSGRTTLDLLGKSDPVIAKGPPATDVFFPGHNKWNYAYSIGEQRPDLVVQIDLNETSHADMARWGYVQLGNGMWIRRDTTRVDRARIGGNWQDPQVLDALLKGSSGR